MYVLGLSIRGCHRLLCHESRSVKFNVTVTRGECALLWCIVGAAVWCGRLSWAPPYIPLDCFRFTKGRTVLKLHFLVTFAFVDYFKGISFILGFTNILLLLLLIFIYRPCLVISSASLTWIKQNADRNARLRLASRSIPRDVAKAVKGKHHETTILRKKMNEIPHQRLAGSTLESTLASPEHWWFCRASWRPQVHRVAAPQRLFVPPRESDSLMPPWTRVRRPMDNRTARCVRRPSSPIPTRPAPALPRSGSLLTGGKGKGLCLGISGPYTYCRFFL